MKQFLAIIAAIIALPLAALSQQSLPLQPNVQEVCLNGAATLTVMQGTPTRFECADTKVPMPSVDALSATIKEADENLVLYLEPGRSMTFKAKDFSHLTFSGSFAQMERFGVVAQTMAVVRFIGSTSDTLRASNIKINAEDIAIIRSDIVFQWDGTMDVNAHGLSAISTVGIDHCGSGDAAISHTNNDSLSLGRITNNGSIVSESYGFDYNEIDHTVIEKVSNAIAIHKTHRFAHPWRSSLNIGWGMSNWGNSTFDAFNGAEGAAMLKTYFNSWHLEYSHPIVNRRHFALSAGVGLEWNRFRFQNAMVDIGNSLDPIAFAPNSAYNYTRATLRTRYITLPISLHFGNPRKWHCSLTALPGIQWSGSFSGIKYKESSADIESTVLYSGTNGYLRPYKLDVRATVSYKDCGLFVQVATMSAFKSSFEPLYPIKFGIIF